MLSILFDFFVYDLFINNYPINGLHCKVNWYLVPMRDYMYPDMHGL